VDFSILINSRQDDNGILQVGYEWKKNGYVTADELAEVNKCQKCGSINTKPVPTSLEAKRAAGEK
jgi:hypothetical protein